MSGNESLHKELKGNKREKLKELIAEGRMDFVQVCEDLYRVGYCAKCGECCKVINIRTTMNTEVADWLMMHGLKVTLLDATSGIISIEKPCAFLVKKKNGEYKCDVYDNRPVMCKSYPKSQSSHKSCKFMFVDKLELDWFLKQKRVNYHPLK